MVEEDKMSEASMSKEDRQQLESSIVVLSPREQEEADQDIVRGVCFCFTVVIWLLYFLLY